MSAESDCGQTLEFFRFDPCEMVPNNLKLPVVLWPQAVRPGSDASEINELMARNGWGGNWTWTVFDYHHFHPNAHEALTVATGWADLMLGGPKGEIFHVTAGDTIVLPAGTGHCRIAASSDFNVCGGYPAGQHNYETVRATDGYSVEMTIQIHNLPVPRSDPIFGAEGPLTQIWFD